MRDSLKTLRWEYGVTEEFNRALLVRCIIGRKAGSWHHQMARLSFADVNSLFCRALETALGESMVQRGEKFVDRNGTVEFVVMNTEWREKLFGRKEAMLQPIARTKKGERARHQYLKYQAPLLLPVYVGAMFYTNSALLKSLSSVRKNLKKLSPIFSLTRKLRVLRLT